LSFTSTLEPSAEKMNDISLVFMSQAGCILLQSVHTGFLPHTQTRPKRVLRSFIDHRLYYGHQIALVLIVVLASQVLGKAPLWFSSTLQGNANAEDRYHKHIPSVPFELTHLPTTRTFACHRILFATSDLPRLALTGASESVIEIYIANLLVLVTKTQQCPS